MAILIRSHKANVRQLWLGFLLCLSFVGVGQAVPSLEYKLQAVYLFRFLQFTQWPNESFSSPGAPIVLGIIGTDPFDTALEEAIRDEAIGGRKVVIKRFTNAAEIDQCHALYISRSEQGQLPAILARVRGMNVLTVSDIGGFADQGGMIGFFKDQGRVKFEINTTVLKATRLRIGSQLLKIARISGN